MKTHGVALLAATTISIGAEPRGRIYGYENIRRMLQQQKRSYGGGGRFSPHNGEREIARRLRQAQRNADRRRDRCIAKNGFGEEGQIGLSRRGYVLVFRDGAIRHMNGRIVS